MTLPHGAVVAGYTIDRVLGAGGMGTVYLARHPSLPRYDALKILSAELSADPQFRARFLREADLAATLDHPNIVRVHTRGETDTGQLWIAMQFVDGTDADALLRQGPLPAPRAVHIVRQVAKALDHAHSRNLLHRDIKPANFLLAGPADERERVLLADFGIARAMDDAAGLTATGMLVATVAYAPPEAISGDPVDHRADVYSLGGSLYRLLTGKTPYHRADGMPAVLTAHLMSPPPRVTDLAPALPAALDTVIATAMAKDPRDRYPTAGALAAAATAALGYPSTAAPSGPMLTAPWGPAPHHTGPLPFQPPPPMPPAWAPAPTEVTYPSGHFSGRWAEPTMAAPTPPRRRRRLWIAVAAAVVIALTAAGIAAVTLPDSDTPAPYAAQTFAHTFGSTTITTRPHAVAALGPGDADAVLSLGVQPAALLATAAELPSWLTDLIHGSPTVVHNTDPQALTAAHPDLILDTAATRQIYDKLTAVAPTITRPAGDRRWDPAAQLSWIATILGEQAAGDHLRDQAAADATALRQQNPTFAGKTASVLTFTDSGLSGELSQSPAANYLSGLGFAYDDELQSDSQSSDEKPIQPDTVYRLKSDVTLVLRTDKAAGAGGFGGLPQALTALPGTVVIVDQPDTVAALQTAGPAATRYLNTTLVPAVAAQLR